MPWAGRPKAPGRGTARKATTHVPLSPFGAGHTAPPWGRANAAGDNALRPVLLALLVDTGLACLLFAWGAVTGVLNAFGWVAEVVILVFAVSFVYYRLGKS